MDTDQMDAMAELITVIRKIRQKCPWDSVQTLESLKERFTSETAEVLDAIERAKEDRGENLCEELGDILMLVILESMIAEEEGYFSLKDVIRDISWKMRFRHPNIFPSEDPSLRGLSWEELKEKERELRKDLHNKGKLR